VNRRLASALPLLVGFALLAASPAPAGKAPRPVRTAVAPAALPRLVDLGAGKCIPCKKMAPIIEALKVDYSGAVDVQFVDVWQNPDAGRPYKIRLIPTQIFFDRTGRERFRHEGFFAREEIERIFKDSLGVKLRPATAK
jgi:thioredoxin 1